MIVNGFILYYEIEMFIIIRKAKVRRFGGMGKRFLRKDRRRMRIFERVSLSMPY